MSHATLKKAERRQHEQSLNTAPDIIGYVRTIELAYQCINVHGVLRPLRQFQSGCGYRGACDYGVWNNQEYTTMFTDDFDSVKRRRYSGSCVWLVFFVLTATGCASGPIKINGEPPELTVAQVRSQLVEDSEMSLPVPGAVLWGGVVINTENLSDATQIEVMGYPLDRRQRPMTNREAEGRFLVRYEGYLEPVDYAAGRSVTVLGTLSGVITGAVGAAEYRYPLVQSDEIHLWRQIAPAGNTGFMFGVGINLGN